MFSIIPQLLVFVLDFFLSGCFFQWGPLKKQMIIYDNDNNPMYPVGVGVLLT